MNIFLFFPLYTAIKTSDWREGKKEKNERMFQNHNGFDLR